MSSPFQMESRFSSDSPAEGIPWSPKRAARQLQCGAGRTMEREHQGNLFPVVRWRVTWVHDGERYRNGVLRWHDEEWTAWPARDELLRRLRAGQVIVVFAVRPLYDECVGTMGLVPMPVLRHSRRYELEAQSRPAGIPDSTPAA